MATKKVEIKPVVVAPIAQPKTPVTEIIVPVVAEKPKGKEVKCHRCGTLMVLFKNVENETVFQCPQCSAKISFTR